MAGRIIIDGVNPALDSNGKPDAGARLFFFRNGTTVLQSVYSDAALATPLLNPVSCNSAGRFVTIWAPDDAVYSVKWTLSSGTIITFDDIAPVGTSATAPTVYVEQFGALGDGETNDLLAFQDASRFVHAAGGGEIIYGGNGKNYRIAFTEALPALVLGSHTTLRRVGGGQITIDPNTLADFDQPEYPGAYGAITTGDPVTMTRAGSGIGTTTDGFILATIDASSIVYDVHVVDADIQFVALDDLFDGTTKSCHGIHLWFAHDTTIENCIVDGAPGNGMALHGCANSSFVGRNIARNCGFGQTGGQRNGFSMTGYMVLDNADLSSRNITCDALVAEEIQDEAVQFACIKGLHIASVIAKGFRDRAIEGDFAYFTAHVQGDGLLGGQEIPNEVIIGDVIADGLSSDGTSRGHRGVTFDCGNQGRLSIGRLRLRNISAGSAPGSIITFDQANGGRCFIADVTLEGCDLPSNSPCILIQAEVAYVGDMQIIDCSSIDTALVRFNNCANAEIADVDSDSGFYRGVEFVGTVAMTRAVVRNVSMRGSVGSFISIAVGANIGLLEVRGCDVTGVNSAGSNAEGFLQFGSNSLTITDMVVERNRARFANDTVAPIMVNGGVTIPSGAIANAVIRDNDFFDPPHLTQAFGQSTVISTTIFGSLISVSNQIPGERTISATAIPTTGQFWGLGDRVINAAPAAGGISDWRCATAGSFGTLTGVTGAITTGTKALALSGANAAQVTIGTWITIAGVTAPKKVVGRSGGTATLDNNADATVSGAAVAFSPPGFTSIPSVGVTGITLNPQALTGAPADAALNAAYIIGNSNNRVIQFAVAGANASILTNRFNGTFAAPTGILAADVLFSIGAGGYDGSTVAGSSSTVQVRATQNWGTGAHGSRIVLSTTKTGSTSRVDALTIENDGTVVFNKSYTVSTLPTGQAGARTYVTDAVTPTFGAAPVGGGSKRSPVYWDDNLLIWLCG